MAENVPWLGSAAASIAAYLSIVSQLFEVQSSKLVFRVISLWMAPEAMGRYMYRSKNNKSCPRISCHPRLAAALQQG